MLRILLEGGFQGRLYPVNRYGGEVLGIKAYTSVKNIPGAVDYAFIQVPAKASIEIIRDCGAKGVRLATLFTAGFGESEADGGSKLEQELVSAARQSGVRLLGPNCMGIYHPAENLSFAIGLPAESGSLGALCQSGGNSVHLVRAAAQRGINLSKVIGYGNAADLNEADLMEYFAQDPESKAVIAYIEGAREGKRFFRALKVAAQAKPVIVFKGGQSEVGNAAALCHTGSLSGSKEVWDSLVKQARAIQAHNIDECVDIALALLLMKSPRGRRAAVIGFGGGATVQAADDCCGAGLVLPSLPETIKWELKKFTRLAGNIFRNPLDMSDIINIPPEMGHAVRVVGNWTGIDLLILHLGVEIGPYSLLNLNTLEALGEALIDAAKEVGKPAVLVAHAICSPHGYQEVSRLQEMCSEASLPFYPSIQRAASAINKVIKYYETR
jgi:acyl-CoA synthetase (NDP forming)